MKKLLYSALVICAFSFASCGGGGCDADDITNAAQKISEAGVAYTTDSSAENCAAYKSAIDDYIDELDDCDLVTQETLDGFKSLRDDLVC